MLLRSFISGFVIGIGGFGIGIGGFVIGIGDFGIGIGGFGIGVYKWVCAGPRSLVDKRVDS